MHSHIVDSGIYYVDSGIYYCKLASYLSFFVVLIY